MNHGIQQKELHIKTLFRTKKKIYEDEEENFYTEEFITFAKEIQSIVDDLNDIKKTINQKSTEDLQEKIVSEVLN